MVTEMSHSLTVQIQNARDKLQGKHPSDILLAELAPKHSSTKHWAALQVSVWLAAVHIAWRLCKDCQHIFRKAQPTVIGTFLHGEHHLAPGPAASAGGVKGLSYA